MKTKSQQTKGSQITHQKPIQLLRTHSKQSNPHVVPYIPTFNLVFCSFNSSEGMKMMVSDET